MKGVYLIELDKLNVDERGFFARSWDKSELEKYGLETNIAQCSISYNKKKGTIRGLHYQKPPYEETKIIRCTSGKLYDVVLDLRKSSSTYTKWESFELSRTNYKMIYIPKGIAHGFQTLEKNTEIFYQISEYHVPDYYSGIRWNDPAFNIIWPLDVSEVSKKDSSYNLFEK